MTATALETGRRLRGARRNPQRRASRHAWLLIAGLLIVTLLCSGCQPRRTRFEIVDYDNAGVAVRYFEDFEECYYALDAHGNVEIVARRAGPSGSDTDTTTTQVLHLRGIWRAVPGTTRVESTQINATVSYWITGASGGVGFEGGGFVTFDENRRGNTLTGKLELSTVQPTRQVASPPLVFARAELTGKFRAVRDKRRVVRILNETRRFFGPLPRYDAPPSGPM